MTPTHHQPLPSSRNIVPVRALASRGRAVSFRAGDVIFREGSAGDALYLVIKGRVELHRSVEGAWRHSMGARGIGDMVGLLSVMDGAPREATAVATEPCSMVRVEKASLFELIETDPTVGNALLNRICQVMASRLEDTHQRVAG